MAIDFETEEKSRKWMFILPIVILTLALCAALWAYMGKSSDLKHLRSDHSIATKELMKFRKLYSSTASDVRGSEHMADIADIKLKECLRANTELQDELTALELSLQTGTAGQQQ